MPKDARPVWKVPGVLLRGGPLSPSARVVRVRVGGEGYEFVGVGTGGRLKLVMLTILYAAFLVVFGFFLGWLMAR